MASRHSPSNNISAPGVYIHELSGGSHPIIAVGTSTAGFVGQSPKSITNQTTIAAANLKSEVIDNWRQFKKTYFSATKPDQDQWTYLAHAVHGFFLNGGSRCWVIDMGKEKTSLAAPLEALAKIDEIALVAAPGFTTDDDHKQLASHASQLKDRVAILDIPATQDSAAKLGQYTPTDSQTAHGYTSMYAPWLYVANPQQPGKTVTVPPSGHIAGIWARNDASRGVHKAPANEVINGAVGLTLNITNQTQAGLSNKGINIIRHFRDSGYVVWGAHTLATDPEWRYLNVRRLFNMIEESIAESTRWSVLEPNDELLWTSIRRDVGAFLNDLWQQGALMGTTPEEAFFVKCDAENNPADSIQRGRMIIDIGIALTYPTEFVIFRISQHEAGTDIEMA